MEMCFLKLLILFSFIVSESLIATSKHRDVLLQRADIQFSERVDFPGIGTVVQTCSKSTSCTLMTKCANAFSSGNRKKFPSICKWQNSDPWVCCPTAAKLQNKAGLKNFPENECAEPRSTTLFRSPGINPGLLRKKRALVNHLESAIVGGENVPSENPSINIYPFMAALYQTAGKEKAFLCGGTLISKDAILTAAHCFLAMDSSSKYMVQLGSINFVTAGKVPNLVEFVVSSVKIHEGFKYPQLYDDIALVKFKGLKSFSDATRPICLVDQAKDSKARSEVVILGWGSKQLGGSPSAILQEAQIKTIPNTECNRTLATMGSLTVSFPKGIVNKILCAGSQQNKDACQGDSGGPLVAVIDGKWRQRGIISGGIGCGIPGNPGIYTRVAEYNSWIKTNA